MCYSVFFVLHLLRMHFFFSHKHGPFFLFGWQCTLSWVGEKYIVDFSCKFAKSDVPYLQWKSCEPGLSLLTSFKAEMPQLEKPWHTYVMQWNIAACFWMKSNCPNKTHGAWVSGSKIPLININVKKKIERSSITHPRVILQVETKGYKI